MALSAGSDPIATYELYPVYLVEMITSIGDPFVIRAKGARFGNSRLVRGDDHFQPSLD